MSGGSTISRERNASVLTAGLSNKIESESEVWQHNTPRKGCLGKGVCAISEVQKWSKRLD